MTTPHKKYKTKPLVYFYYKIHWIYVVIKNITHNSGADPAFPISGKPIFFNGWKAIAALPTEKV